MAWETRGNRRYYYRAERVGGRVVKTYVGAGAIAEHAAAVDAERRALRKAVDDEQDDECEEQLETLDRCIEELLHREGFHRPKRGRWRRKRIAKSKG